MDKVCLNLERQLREAYRRAPRDLEKVLAVLRQVWVDEFDLRSARAMKFQSVLERCKKLLEDQECQ